MKKSEVIEIVDNVIKFAQKDRVASDVIYSLEKLGVLLPKKEIIEQHVDGVKYVEVEGWEDE